MFYLVCADIAQRTRLIEDLKRHGILAVFHYLSLHKSPYYAQRHDGRELPNSDMFSDCLVRLPLYFDLTDADIGFITERVRSFFR
jgi:dTDP-4-amino-4,6-dideoxygalactose transaminase